VLIVSAIHLYHTNFAFFAQGNKILVRSFLVASLETVFDSFKLGSISAQAKHNELLYAAGLDPGDEACT
jgi:hypothetical protein